MGHKVLLTVDSDTLTSEQLAILEAERLAFAEKRERERRHWAEVSQRRRERERVALLGYRSEDGHYVAPLARVLRDYGGNQPWERMCVYIVREGAEVLYVGCSSAGARTRIRKHCSPSKPTQLGLYLRSRWKEAQCFTVECLINEFDSDDPEWVKMPFWEIEEQKIKELKPRFNFIHSDRDAAEFRAQRDALIAEEKQKEKERAERALVEAEEFEVYSRRRLYLLRIAREGLSRRQMRAAVMRARELGVLPDLPKTPETLEQRRAQWPLIARIIASALTPPGDEHAADLALLEEMSFSRIPGAEQQPSN